MSFVKVKSGGIWGIEGYEVSVEIDISPGIPSFTIVGLPDSAIKESRERVRSAIKNLGYSFPQKRITVNLSPSDTKKQGTLYDLPIALGLLALGDSVDKDTLGEFIFLGEVSLDGALKPVRGVLPIVASLHSESLSKFILPLENALEGAVIEKAEVYAFENLKEVIEFLNRAVKKEPVRVEYEKILRRKKHDIDLNDVLGQPLVKKALEISSAGAHNLSMVGAPGSGKSMLAKRVITILPPMDFSEMLEVSRIYSVAGLLTDELVSERPFRSPHHTSSEVALIGGGSVPMPGEVSLAHRGVLFLDELPEFSRKTLEVLRQPMEDGYINVARAQGRVRFPAKFTLISAQNPCPCGNYGNPFKRCTCSPAQIRNYNGRVSQPIRDRMDMNVWVEPVEREELLKHEGGESSKEVFKRVLKAYEIQKERFKDSETDFNGRMTNREVELHCLAHMTAEAKKLLESAVERLNLSARGYFRALKVSRTVADLEESESIGASHIALAVQLRVEEKLET